MRIRKLEYIFGLTAFSNMLQLTVKRNRRPSCCGLTAFSNMLQLTKYRVWSKYELRLDRIF